MRGAARLGWHLPAQRERLGGGPGQSRGPRVGWHISHRTGEPAVEVAEIGVHPV